MPNRLPVPQSTPQLAREIFTPESQGAAVARGQAAFGSAVSRGGQQLARRIQERKAQSEISELNAEFARAQSELTVAWQERLATADPNDDTTAETFRNEVVAQRLEAIKELANTRESKAFFERAAAGLSSGFLVTTEAGQRGLRETAAVQNFDTMLNQMGDSVTTDPLSFDSVLTMSELQLEGLVQSEGLSREKALVLKQAAQSKIAIGAATGLINRDPGLGRQEIESGRFSEFIDAQEKNRLLAYADSQERAIAAAEEKARKRAAGAAQVSAMQQAINTDGSINVESLPQIQADIIRDPDLASDPASLRATVNFLDALAEDATSGAKFGQTNPAVFNNIMQRATLPPGHPDRPTRNEVLFLANNGLSVSHANFLADKVVGQEGSVREQLGNQFRNSGLKAAAARLTGSSAIELAEDPGLVENYNRFLQFALLTEQEMLTQGSTPTEIWAADGPILGRVQEFDRRLSLDEQTQAFQEQLERESSQTAFPAFEGEDPSKFDVGGKTGSGLNGPPLRTGPNLGATFNGKQLKELSPAEMDKWLKENQ